MTDVQFKITEHTSEKILTIEFGPRLRSDIILNGTPQLDGKPTVNIVNTVYRISELKQQIIEQESRGEISIPVGVYTRLEVETANILFQAEEIAVDFQNDTHVEKAYQNLMDNLIVNASEYSSPSAETRLESFLVLLSIPFIDNEETYSDTIAIHLNALKKLGFKQISFLNQIASSFYSQKDIINQSMLEHPKGILLNIGKTTQIGIMDQKILREAFLDINLGTTSALNHSLAIMRDLNILGVKPGTVVQWLVSEGRVDGKAPLTTKTVRRKDFNITAILNSPKILFDYKAITLMENQGPNSIIEGIQQALQITNQNLNVNIDDLLKTVIVTGPGALFKGISEKIYQELSKIYTDKEIKIFIGEDPLNTVTNGLINYINLYPRLKAFNLVDDEDDISIEPSAQDKLTPLLDLLDTFKSLVINLDELQNYANQFKQGLTTVPDQAKPRLNVKIHQESKYWSLEFNNYLKPMREEAQKGLEETEAVASKFRTIGIQLAKLPDFIRLPLAKVFSSHVNGLKMIKRVHIEKQSKNRVDVLHNANLQVKDEYGIDELINATSFQREEIEKYLDEYLEKYPNFGFIDDTFVKFNEEKLILIEKQFDKVSDEYFDSMMLGSNSKKGELMSKGSSYCKFLIKGYRFLNNQAKAEKFEEELKTFDNVFSESGKFFI